MRFIFHLLGIIYFLIWILIGAALLVGAFALIKVKPWQMVGGLINGGGLGGLSSMVGNVGNVGDLLQKIQTKNGNVPEIYNSLPKEQQACLKKEIGDKTVESALLGKLNLTPDLVLKAMKCVK